MSTTTAAPSGAYRTYLGLAFGVGAGALWGLVFLAPELVRSFSPLELAAGRYLAYGVVSALLILPRWRTLHAVLTRRDWLSLFWLSLAGNTLYYILVASAVQLGSVAMASLVVGFLPVTVTLIGSRDRGAVPLRALFPSVLLCAAGALSIGWQAIGATTAGTELLGLICAFGALASWTAYAVGNSRCLARLPHLSAHDWSLLTGVVTGAQALLLVPLVALIQPQHAPAEWLQFAGVSIGVAILASICGNALWNWMSRLLPLTLVGQMIVFETVFALLYGFLWEQRWPQPLELLACAFVLAGVISCLRAHRGHGVPATHPDAADERATG
ncbi:multidrug DMT transporter permease [Devosia insulae DS-56]|uniref:Multidrug DMT transporter permease n=1 Tax=Devosia insulae DS-56 TaxID=1116389 RepID=A0A1E5XMQ0_9HYPH|nr:DMT family transporter [Devosia insulae]OEO29890.1 multidrug DMT transporter permease [Devosia insulae DS-56]